MNKNIPDNPFNINLENLPSFVEQAKDYAIFKGILFKKPDLSKDAIMPLAFCLFPSNFPERWFNLACELQIYMNLVLFKVALSKEFLKECLSSTIEADEFTANIFKIYETVEDENNGNEQLHLGILRSDYLLDCDSSGKIIGIKQVESNTIAASFGGLAPNTRDLHKFVLTRTGKDFTDKQLPINESTDKIALGLIAAWESYNNPSAVVLFVLEEYTTNVFDQRAVEYAILKRNNAIGVVRYTFKELGFYAKLEDKKLILKDKQEVAVVYYRTGYVPHQYEPQDWETRLLMERSTAVKCPSAGLQLAGTKRVQVQLGYPGVLEKFVDADVADKLRQVFVNQYSLDLDEKGDEAVSLGINQFEKYVLKPEREGGGNNLYGSDIKNMLESIKLSDKRRAYILMERINPPKISNCIVMSNKTPQISEITSELGTYGVIIGNKKEILLNTFAGHLLRSKDSNANETGIVAGFGALDSPYLE